MQFNGRAATIYNTRKIEINDAQQDLSIKEPTNPRKKIEWKSKLTTHMKRERTVKGDTSKQWSLCMHKTS